VTTQPQPETPPEIQPEIASNPPLRPISGLTLASPNGGGAGSPILKVAIAALVVIIAIAAYVYFGEKPPVVTGEILHLTAFPIHRESNAKMFATQSLAPVENKFDQMIVVADVRLHNQSTGPVFLSDMSATLKLPTEEDRSLAAIASDFNRVFIAYPELASLKQEPLLRDITIPAGATVDGQLVFNYPTTKEQWDQRHSLELTLSFTHQKDLVLLAPQ
jgi:hypothetical protein